MGATNTIVTRAIKDAEFRQRLINNPKATIEKELGIQFAEGVTVQVYQNSPSLINIVLPAVETESMSPTRPTLKPMPIGGSPILEPLPGMLSPIATKTFGKYTSCCS